MDLHLSSGYAEDAQKTAIRHLIKNGLIESELEKRSKRRTYSQQNGIYEKLFVGLAEKAENRGV